MQALEKLRTQTQFWGHGWIQKQNELIGQLFESSQQTVNIVIVQILIQFSRPNLCTAAREIEISGIYTSQLLHTLKTQKEFQQKKKKKKTQKGFIVNHNEIDRDF